MDFVGRFERLAEDMQHVGDVLGIPISLGHNRDSRKRGKRSVLSEEGVGLVNRLYSEDIRTFGYEGP
jgi:hypothetical protein